MSIGFSGGGGGGGGTVTVYSTRPALVGAALSDLTALSPQDGEIGVIRLGTWPNLHQVELTYYSSQSKWVGEPIPIIQQTDQEYMAPAASGSTTDRYVGTATVGGGANQSGWATRYLNFAGDLIVAGLSLQANFSAIVQGDGSNGIAVTPYWYADTPGAAVVHVQGGATAGQPQAGYVAAGPTLTSPTTTQITYARSGWTNVALTPPSGGWAGKVVWIGLFAHMTPAAGGGTGNVIDADVSVRWIG